MLNKKILILLACISILVLMSSCKKDVLNMLVPSGSPQFAQLYMQNSSDYEVTVVQGADPLVSAFASESYDIIIAPTNLGAKLYQSKQSYQLAASITWGNYYLISKEVIKLDDLDNQDVIAFGQNQTPDAILQYVLKDIPVQISYLDSVTSVVSDFIIDGSQIYLVAEPSLSILKASYTLSIIDLQDLYQEKTGRNSYPQASVFVNSELSDRMVKNIKDDFKKSIEDTLDNPLNAAILAIALGINMEQAIIESAIGNSHIIYKSSDDAKEDIIIYLEMLKTFNSNFTGDNLPDDSFYR